MVIDGKVSEYTDNLWTSNVHEHKATTIYARPGVNVDAGRSGDREVTLTNLGQKSTGRYRCEVSTEAPSFATVSNYGDMVVVGKWLS